MSTNAMVAGSSGSASPSPGGTGRRSGSADRDRKRGSYGEGRRGRSHSRNTSLGVEGNGNAVPGVSAVVPPPKERLPPSPPLTPVASKSSLRKTAAAGVGGGAGRGGGEEGITKGNVESDATHAIPSTSTPTPTPRSGKFKEAPPAVGRTGDTNATSADGSGLRDDEKHHIIDGGGEDFSIANGNGHARMQVADVDVDVDTEPDGTLSTWSFRPDGDTTTNRRSREVRDEATTNGDIGGHEHEHGHGHRHGRDPEQHTLAQPSGVDAAIPQSPARDHNIPPQEPSTDASQEDIDPLSGSDESRPQSQQPDLFPTAAATGAAPSSGMSSSHEASLNGPLPPHLHPLGLGNAPSPQPWEVIEPPPDNNLQMEEIMRRTRKESNRSVPGYVGNVVVKDGKKYRIPRSSYYFGPPPDTSAFGTDPIGHIGVHHPREVVRVERDYSGGELIQFSPAYPLEFEGRITPTQFLETINMINEMLIEAHSLRWSFLDNTLAVLTLYISRFFVSSHYDRKMGRLKEMIEEQNKRVYNPVGLNILWPKDVAFMFLEIEYY
ncbi:uncharacterized protein FOMMEDRAFT_167657 [Fomitiporia mediterranea MF3/22]|uniref:uncharacterized protein n=1 Tax=Fomitiporia mediterranea (strain MF3/22) TaxID=694068 RepID=UPI0004408603|nr:uncharacterized protein FOMMEDRAFT_167657 [Fomitiporia mediterranea MF3/22]EJD04480.1 hypothetical protein FOMMEDRAFT_167657 [Fomitiporia mediterranea MF3/22]